MTSSDGKIVVAICGASGSIYGVRMLTALLALPFEVHSVISEAGGQVLTHETGYSGGDLKAWLQSREATIHPDARLIQHEPDNLFAPPASGSFRYRGMVVAPCSMKTLAVIASGVANDLISRSADVCLKEKRPLVLITRETPLSLIHIDNMARAARAGAVIMPPCPGFYNRPETITDIVDGTVARALDQLGIDNQLTKRWGDRSFV